ncbi:hypothetical protein B4O97_05035 [Marispirochaeta aestuarii]|uniref:Lipoprotein n=1 Tax=Marispirochaeta aestuarii TaxID=1963862 RepID=A0A1Y1S0V9_9SPIO|nr:hypothetical protein [Marispirochaeta aestuarii]ORC36992.1 hypothetical protein B4O97_05035 [Marispirochaeta aestuarii]
MKRKQVSAMGLILLVIIIVTGCSRKVSPEAAEKSIEADAVSAASIVDTAQGFLKAAGKNGTWIIAITQDITTDQEILVEGQFTRRDEIYRKIALYAQDENRNVTARYTLTAPKLTVRSENTRIQGGTFAGDVYVEANKFHIYDGKVDGDIYFARDEYKSSFSLQEGGEVTGALKVR